MTIRKADMEAARQAIRIAPGPHPVPELIFAEFEAIIESGFRTYHPAVRARYRELADELGRRIEANRKWGWRP